MLLFGAGVFLYVGGDRWLMLAESPIYNGAYCLATLWFATLLNLVGLQRAKWLQNIGGIAAWTATVLVLAGGLVAWCAFGAMTPITAAGLMPDFRSMPTLASLATISFAYAGMELGPIIGGEIKEPQKTIPRAILIAGVLIAAIYIAGTAALLTALPAEHISLIGGIPQALAAVGERVGLPAFGAITAGLIALASCGGIGAWITGTARLPFVFGVDHYLPKPFAALHPKFGTPCVALLTQGVLTTIILLAALSGSTIHEAYIVLIDMTIILTFMPLFYIFAALPILRRRAAGSHAGMTLIPGGACVCWLVSGIGFATTLLAIGTSLVPPEDSSNPRLFLLKTVGGCIVLIAAGLVFYCRGNGTRAQGASEPCMPADACGAKHLNVRS
jgi:amino acid transporter